MSPKLQCFDKILKEAKKPTKDSLWDLTRVLNLCLTTVTWDGSGLWCCFNNSTSSWNNSDWLTWGSEATWGSDHYLEWWGYLWGYTLGSNYRQKNFSLLSRCLYVIIMNIVPPFSMSLSWNTVSPSQNSLMQTVATMIHPHHQIMW